jgi:hypothetical protein
VLDDCGCQGAVMWGVVVVVVLVLVVVAFLFVAAD